MSKVVTLRVNGSTSNLGAGFDTVGLAVALPLQVTFSFNHQRATPGISAQGEGLPEISRTENNLILRAFRRACRELDETPPPCTLTVDNRIPLRRGLGSSGAATIAGLLAASAYFDRRLTRPALLNLAGELEGHPENASASLLGGLTVNGVHRDEVICERFVPPPDWVAACFVPEVEVPTEAARRVLPDMVTRWAAIGNVQSTALLVAAFAKHKSELLAFATQDQLHQPYRKSLIPGYDAIMAAAREASAYGVFLSGSGSTLLAICAARAGEAVAARMAAAAQAEHVAGRPLVLPFSAEEAVVEIA